MLARRKAALDMMAAVTTHQEAACSNQSHSQSPNQARLPHIVGLWTKPLSLPEGDKPTGQQNDDHVRNGWWPIVSPPANTC